MSNVHSHALPVDSGAADDCRPVEDAAAEAVLAALDVAARQGFANVQASPRVNAAVPPYVDGMTLSDIETEPATLTFSKAERGDDGETYHGAVPVDGGTIMVMDPCGLPDVVLRQCVNLGAVIVSTPRGDGLYPVIGETFGLIIGDPYSHDKDGETASRWGDVDIEN